VTHLSNPKGSALIEALPVSILLVTLVSGLMIAAYLLCARSWIQYQSEQALYCVSEGHSRERCKFQLKEQLERFLPWGDTSVALTGANERWQVEVQWKYCAYAFRLRKELTPKQILNAKALPW
jgi:hypothetical protein